MATNSERIGWAENAIDGFAVATFFRAFDALPDGDQEDCIADLICNLTHLARARGFNTEAVLARAQSNFEFEKGLKMDEHG